MSSKVVGLVHSHLLALSALAVAFGLVAADARAQASRPRRHLPPVQSGQRIQPSDFEYLGAFRLPDTGGELPAVWEYGGQGATYRPNGDPSGATDGFPGSILATGLDTDHFVSEISIPRPVISATKSLDDLPTATTLQPFANVRGGLFSTLTEIPRVGLAYLSTSQTGEKVHLCWGAHFQEDSGHRVASHAWFDPTLNAPHTQGAWFIGNQLPYSVNGYLFEIERSWADAHVGGRQLATGRFKDGGWSGQGPALFAYAPWLSGNPPAPGTKLSEVPLVLYASTHFEDPNGLTGKLSNYQHPDEWEGGAWLTTSRGASAVVFVGTKGTGPLYWYGWINPQGPEIPCVEMEGTGMVGCHRADGSLCPAELIRECQGHTSERGWWASRFDAQVIFYDPRDLAAVAAGTMSPDEPQPYAVLDIDDQLFLPDPPAEPDGLGRGVQRRYRIGETCYDRQRGHLFVFERFGDGAKPLVHVWRVK
jgi:hypothetical protein